MKKSMLLLLSLMLFIACATTAEVIHDYYPSGKLKAEIRMVEGEPHGTMKIYYENGALKQTVNFNNGVLHGPTKIYYQTGELKQLLVYENGNIIQNKIFDRGENTRTPRTTNSVD